MARGWFFNIPTHGHINPTLPLVSKLVDQGDAITYFAGPAFAGSIRAAGAAYGDYGLNFPFEESRSEAHIVLQGSRLAAATNALLGPVMALAAAEWPDYVLFDLSAPWGRIAARRLGIPAVASFPHLPFDWRVLFTDRRLLKKGLAELRPGWGYYRALLGQLRSLARDHHLRRPSELNILSSAAGLNIVFSSRYFQPLAGRFDGTYRFIGPVIRTQRPDIPLTITRRPGQKLIYIAVGTLYQASLDFFRRCLAAFGGEEYAVVLSVGRAIDPAELGPVPANFTVGQYVPQLEILDQADLFISHGGLNSISEAVMAGVPLVVVPNTVEQALNGAQVERLGAGIYLEPEMVNPGRLRDAAGALLNDAGTRQALARIRRSFVAAGGVERGAAAVQGFKRQHQVW